MTRVRRRYLKIVLNNGLIVLISRAHLAILNNGPQLEGVVAQWCNPLTLQPEQSGGVGSIRGRAPPLERHDKGSRIRLAPSHFCDPSALR